MKLMSERNQLRDVAERWKRSYFDGAWHDISKGSSEAIYESLAALDPETATAADVARIASRSWCCPNKCNECGEESWDVVELGQEPDHDASTAWICVGCLRKAVALVDSEARS